MVELILANIYFNEGWTVIKSWKHEIKEDIEAVVDGVAHTIEKVKQHPPI